MRNFTLRPDKKDFRDLRFTSSKFKSPSELPKSVDFLKDLPPVFDQGQLGSCTANAGVAFLMYLLKRAGIDSPELSRLFLYYYERLLEGTVGEDSGASMRDGLKVMQQKGVSPEDLCKYIIERFTEAPSQEAIEAAAAFKLAKYERIHDLHEMKAALAERRPVLLGIAVYESFETPTKQGRIPMPKPKVEQLLGYHEVLAAGYSDYSKPNQGVAKVRNSWGLNWGLKGNFLLPYDYFDKYVIDMWTGDIPKVK